MSQWRLIKCSELSEQQTLHWLHRLSKCDFINTTIFNWSTLVRVRVCYVENWVLCIILFFVLYQNFSSVLNLFPVIDFSLRVMLLFQSCFTQSKWSCKTAFNKLLYTHICYCYATLQLQWRGFILFCIRHFSFGFSRDMNPGLLGESDIVYPPHLSCYLYYLLSV